MEGSTNTLTTLLDSISQVFEAILGHIGTIGNTIVNNPMLLLPFVVSIVITLIFVAKRFITRR